jgi:hypothetical protein
MAWQVIVVYFGNGFFLGRRHSNDSNSLSFNIDRGNRMIAIQAGYKARMPAALMVVFALWTTFAIAGLNEDFLEAEKRILLPAIKGFIGNGADVNAKDNHGQTTLMFDIKRGRAAITD